MVSELRVDKIHNEGGDNDSGIDLSTNDQIVLKTANTTRLTMDATGQTTIVGEGGSTTTSVQQGLAKAWVHFDGSGTVAVNDTLNITSLVDNDTGDYTVSIVNDMANAHYSSPCAASSGGAANTDTMVNPYTWAAGSLALRSNNNAGAAADRSEVNITIHGELA